MPSEKIEIEESNNEHDSEEKLLLENSDLDKLVKESGILTNPNLPGINNVKQQKIQTYVNEIIQSQGFNTEDVQILVKDNGDDIRVTVYNNSEIYTQINYSKIP